ncbi:MAG: TfoX/Sxy family DNA transformation protein [Planctomycetaceae bacterium]
MPATPSGDRLYVNVSATETRRRLAGRGLGVRKVHSHGRNQATILHTAVGKHLQSLTRLFADVGCSDDERQLGQPIQNLRNLGAVSAGWLRDVGVLTIEQLGSLGPAAAYRLVKRRYPRCSLNLLWAIAAGLRELDWRELDDLEKSRLRALVD